MSGSPPEPQQKERVLEEGQGQCRYGVAGQPNGRSRTRSQAKDLDATYGHRVAGSHSQLGLLVDDAQAPAALFDERCLLGF